MAQMSISSNLKLQWCNRNVIRKKIIIFLNIKQLANKVFINYKSDARHP